MRKARAELSNIEKQKWFRLDNAAKIFPGIISSRRTTFFRIQAILKKPVHIGALQKACERIMKRFPYFRVELKAGAFWYYFDYNPNTPRIEADSTYPCQKIKLTRKGTFPFRIKARKSVISVEFSHVLTDGIGATVFLKSLVAEYLHLINAGIDDWSDLPRPGEAPHPGENVDDFRKYYERGLPKYQNLGPAYHLEDKLEPAGVYHIVTGIMPVKELSREAERYGVSLSTYLLSHLFMALHDIGLSRPRNILARKMKPIRIVVPVNLRSIFSSRSMHNFFLTVFPEIDLRLGTYTLDEVIKYVHNYLNIQINDKFILKQLARNVRGELAIMNRIMPLFIKNIGLTLAYSKLGEKPKTTSFSNLGLVRMPRCFSSHIERFDFIPEPSAITKVSCGVIGYKDKVSVTFGRLIREPVVERLFFRKLASLGIPVKIITN